jgi:hypothetical protein
MMTSMVAPGFIGSAPVLYRLSLMGAFLQTADDVPHGLPPAGKMSQ